MNIVVSCRSIYRNILSRKKKKKRFYSCCGTVFRNGSQIGSLEEAGRLMRG